MSVVNRDPMLKVMMGDLDKRIRKLEQSPAKRPYGAFYDTTTQTAASATAAYVVAVGSTSESNLISVTSSNRLTVARKGVYLFTATAQFENSGAADLDAELWFAYNGTNVAWSNSIYNVPGKHGSVNGHTIAVITYLQSLNANDYLTLNWKVEGTAVSIVSTTGLTSPTRPNVPGVIITMNEVAW